MGQTVSLDKSDGFSGDLVIMGRLGATHGLKGAIRLFSFTEPPEEIFTYQKWYVHLGEGWTPAEVLRFEKHAKGFVVYLKGHETSESLMPWVNKHIGVLRADLPALPKGEYYWADLIGLEVKTEHNQSLGTVAGLMEVGKESADLLIVKGDRERYIPYIPGEVILNIDLVGRWMEVAWDPEL